MDDLFDRGHAQKVPEDQREGSPAWYLPDHPVVHPQKPDKVRVVFDCAAKFQNASLNQHIAQNSVTHPGLFLSPVALTLKLRESKDAKQ